MPNETSISPLSNHSFKYLPSNADLVMSNGMPNGIGWSWILMFRDHIGTTFKAQAAQEQEHRTNMLLKVLVTNNQPTPHKIPEEQRPQLHHSRAELH
jgi:hypothetical protein